MYGLGDDMAEMSQEIKTLKEMIAQYKILIDAKDKQIEIYRRYMPAGLDV